MSSCSIPFYESLLSSGTKMHKPVLTPSIKTKSDNSNYYDIKIRMCLDGNEYSKEKSLLTYSPTYLGGNLRFAVAICAYFLLWMPVVDIVNCLQNTMRDASDKVYMGLPPYDKECFKLHHSNTKTPDGKVK